MEATKNTIDKFRGEYGWLSTFWEEPVEYGEFTFRCAEAAFQSEKVTSRVGKLKFTNLSGSDAKKAGRYVSLRDDWDDIKVSVMEEVIRAKFRNLRLREKLLNTGDRLLVEGNTWGDTFWGVSASTGVGENILGKIIMKIREEIRNGRDTEAG